MPRLPLARIIFALSLVSTLFWVLGLLAEAIWSKEPNLLQLVAVSVLLASGILIALLRLSSDFLSKSTLSARQYFLEFIAWYVISYLAIALVVLGIMQVFALGIADTGKSTDPESALLSWMLATWLPLWSAPGLAVFAIWWRSSRKAP